MPVYALNKKIRHDYQILEKFEAGLVLSGHEVKAVREGQVSLKGAYISIDKNNQAILKNASISKYKKAGQITDYDPERERKILLTKKELKYLTGKCQQIGLTIVPISLYTKHRKIKLEIGLVKGKKKIDKRQDLKQKEINKNIRQALKRTARG